MNSISVQKIARVLNVLVLITFICNLVAIPLVPCLVDNRFQLDFGAVAATFFTTSMTALPFSLIHPTIRSGNNHTRLF